MINFSFIVSDDAFVTQRILNPSLESSIEIVRENMVSIINIEDLTLFDADFDYIIGKKATLKELSLKVYRNGVFKLDKTLNLQNGKFDYLNKICTLNVETLPTDLVQSVLDNLETKFNLIDFITLRTANLSVQTKLITIYQAAIAGIDPILIDGYEYDSSVINPTIQTWSSIKEYLYSVDGDLTGNLDCFVKYSSHVYYCIQPNINNQPDSSPTYWARILTDYVHTFAKEVSNVTFAGSEIYDFIDVNEPYFWIETGNEILANYPDQTYFNLIRFWKASKDQTTIAQSFTRGRLLQDAIEKILNTINPYILINKNSGLNSWCEYLESTTDYDRLYIFDKSDVKYPTSSIPAYYDNQTLGDIFEMLKNQFNLDWTINNSGYFQLIHPTNTNYFSSNSLYLTDYQNKDISEGNLIQEKKETKAVKNEIWLCEKSDLKIFTQQIISYGTKGSTINNNSILICNNVADLLQGANSNVGNDGICIMNVDGSDNIKILSYIINGYMALDKLIIEHHKQNRPLKFGSLNGVSYEFETQNSDNCGAFLVQNLDIFSVNMFQLVKTKLSDLLGITGFRIVSLKQKLNNDFVEVTLES